LRTIVQSTPPIARGYPFSFQWNCPADEGGVVPFPAGCTLLADVALYQGGSKVATLSTETGSIVRVDDISIVLLLSASDTAGLTNTTAVVDLVRTDPSPDEWLGLRVKLPVEQPITAPRVNS